MALERKARLSGTALNAASISKDKLTTLAEFAKDNNIAEEELTKAMKSAVSALNPKDPKPTCPTYINDYNSPALAEFMTENPNWKLIYDDSTKDGMLISPPKKEIPKKAPGTTADKVCKLTVCYMPYGGTCTVLNIIHIGPSAANELLKKMGIDSADLKKVLLSKTRTVLK